MKGCTPPAWLAMAASCGAQRAAGRSCAILQGPKFGRDLREGEPQMETRILESSINKICSLLAVGFGDAGAEVTP